jgi:hypothetical protein
MLHNLVSELNDSLYFYLSIDDKQSEGTGDELLKLVSKNIEGLTGDEIDIIMRLCKKYNFVLVKWILDIGIQEESTWSYPTGKIINILTLYVRPMFKWE